MSKNSFYNSPLLSLSITRKKYTSLLNLEMHDERVNTKFLPHTVTFLERYFPSVLETQCFNDRNLPFCDEVKNTEIGHLFEHILIDELCVLKIDTGLDFATFNGNTSWNWEKEKEGIFHIVIDIGARDYDLLTRAIEKAIFFLELLFKSEEMPIYVNTDYMPQLHGLSLDNPQKLQQV